MRIVQHLLSVFSSLDSSTEDTCNEHSTTFGLTLSDSESVSTAVDILASINKLYHIIYDI